VLLFLAGLALATAMVAGLLPAIRTWRADVKGSLGARESAGNVPGTGWVAPTLLTVQVSLSFLFLLAAVLMARGLVTTARVNSAFPAATTYVAGVTPPVPAADADAAEFRTNLLRALSVDSRVDRVALTTGIPGLRASSRVLEQGGRGTEPGAPPVRLATYGVSPGFFDVLELGMVGGRPLEEGDMREDASPVIVVDRSFARDELGTLDAAGLRVGLRSPGADSIVSYEIVGVVEDIRIYRDASRDNSVFVPLVHDPSATVFVMYRPASGARDPRAIVGEVVATLRPDLPLDRSMTAGRADEGVPIQEILDYVRTVYTTAGRLGVIGGIAAVAVAVLGLYGLLAYEMRRRRRELGIRIALGAGRSNVVARVVRRGLVRAAPGLAIGVVVALATLPLLGVLLGGSNARDFGLIVTVVLAYAAITSVASIVPALEAAGVDPNVTLRDE
jgi:hypothetical protein